MKKLKEKKIKIYICISELTSMLSAQKRGFKDVAEIYGTFWLDKNEAQYCNKGSHIRKFLLTQSNEKEN